MPNLLVFNRLFLFELFAVFCPEKLRQRFNGKQKIAIYLAVFPLSAFTEASSRYNIVQVRMQTQLLSPSMQNRYDSHLYFFGFAKALKGFLSSFKQSVVHHFRLVYGQRINARRQGENHVEVWHRQKLGSSGLYPIFPFIALAFWTMSIAARIVTDTQIATTITSINMASQFCCSTFFNGIKCS